MSAPHLRNGGWYCDALSSGAFVRLVRDSHLETQRGTVPLPFGQNVLFVRLHPDGVRFAGSGHRDDLCWEWDGAHWISHGPAFGPRAVIYDADGILRIVSGPPPVGHRYVDESGRVVTAEETYADTTRKIWEHTTRFGNVTVGQGGKGEYVFEDGSLVPGDDPAILKIGSTTHLLMPGTCRAINFEWRFDVIALSFVREDLDAAVTWFTSLHEVRQLPVITAKTATGTQNPIPTPKPPEPSMPLGDQTAVVAAVRQKYPTPLGEQHAQCLLEIARAIGQDAGLLRKDSGTNILLPDGVRVAQDIIAFPDGNIYDCLGDGEGAATPGWGHAGVVEPSRYYRVTASVPPIPGIPAPIPGIPPPDPEVGKRLDAIEARLQRLENAGLLVGVTYKP